MKMKKLLALSLLVFCGLSHGQQVVNAVKSGQEIKLGYLSDGFPFSYVNEGSTEPTGFSHDLGLLIVEKIKKNLSLPNATATHHLSTVPNRFELLNSGKIHIHCARNTNGAEYIGTALASMNYFYVESRFIVRKDSGINHYGDIKDKTVGLRKGASVEKFLIKYKNKLRYKEIRHVSDYIESIRMVINKEIDAASTDDFIGLGAAMLMDPLHADDYQLAGVALQKKYYTCFLPQNDPEWKKIVDTAILEIIKSGELKTIYDKWFTQPIPPKNVNFKYPMSDIMWQTVITNPSDQPAHN